MGKKKKEKKNDTKIEDHMEENKIGQSDGLVVIDGTVYYDPSQDGRHERRIPRNTPVVPPP